MDIYPGQSAPADAEYASRYGMFRRRIGGTLHLLPLNGGYEKKVDENGEPVFELTDIRPVRDDAYHDNPNGVLHRRGRSSSATWPSRGCSCTAGASTCSRRCTPPPLPPMTAASAWGSTSTTR